MANDLERNPQHQAVEPRQPQPHLVETLDGGGGAVFQNYAPEGLYQLLSESIPHLIWRAGADGLIDFLSDQWYTFTGISRPYAMRRVSLHQDWQSAIHGDDAAEFLGRWAQSVQSGERFEAECRIHRAGDAWRWHLCRAVPVREKTGRILNWFGTSTDIDDEKRQREEMALASRAKDRFLAMLSHELRTPLTAALLMLAELEAESAMPQQALASLQILRRNIEREAQLVGDLVDVSAAVHGKLALRCRTINMREVVLQALEVCRSELDAKKITLSYAWGDQHSIVIGDPVRLQQVIWNLVKNAAKFTPEGGHVEIGSANESADLLRIWVKDNGIGIVPEAMTRIFAPFEQADPSTVTRFGGLGLGLAIARRIAELHHGSLAGVSDGLGHGATFVLEIPVLPQHRIPVDLDTLASRSAPEVAEKLTILLVDDHADTLRAMSRLLGGFGHQVHCAQTVAAALTWAHLKSFDLVISDVTLADQTGWEFMRAFRQLSKAPAIALTGLGSEDDIRRSMEAGFSDHLIKPVDSATLRACISTVVAETRSASRT